jgi:hypothetical protein
VKDLLSYDWIGCLADDEIQEDIEKSRDNPPVCADTQKNECILESMLYTLREVAH